jgi:hypothetical protein
MKDRMKASDVYRQSHNPFVPKTDFEGAFPNVEAVTVDVTETDEYGHESHRTYSKGDFGQYIDCSNPKCYNGGFAVGNALQSLRFKKLTEGEGDADCQGHEGSPKGRRKGDACEHKFNYKISIVYKKEEESNQDLKKEE